MKKIAKGFYETRVETMVDGEAKTVTVQIHHDEEGTGEWYHIFEGLTDDDCGDTYRTKKEAVEAMNACAEDGWKYHDGLGYCLAN